MSKEILEGEIKHPEVTLQKMLQDDSNKENKKQPGFSRQKAIKDAESKEIADKLQKIYLEDLKEVKYFFANESYERIFRNVPEIPINYLEKSFNYLLKENKDAIKDNYNYRAELGVFISATYRKSVEQYVKREIENGIKYEDIKPLTVNLNVNQLKFFPSNIGYKNKEKMNWIIKGNAGERIGAGMEGGEIRIEGNCSDLVGVGMQGGKIIIGGNAEKKVGAWMKGGEIIVKGNTDDNPGQDMKNGKIIIEGNVGENSGQHKTGGELIIRRNQCNFETTE